MFEATPGQARPVHERFALDKVSLGQVFLIPDIPYFPAGVIPTLTISIN
jgi:hypothetical protein